MTEKNDKDLNEVDNNLEHFPFLFRKVSGLYEKITPRRFPPRFPLHPYFRKELLRLDVDNYYPQMTASGIMMGFRHTIHWIAKLKKNSNGWDGKIWYKDGDVNLFPYTKIKISVTERWIPAYRMALVTFSGGGGREITKIYRFKSKFFHKMNFEFDYAEGERITKSYKTHSHPNRPLTLPNEELTISKVYNRVGFDVSTTAGGNVPITGAGIDARWSNQEMHDAMEVHWSHFASRPQWAIWVFFASLHERGSSLGGIMFDDIGKNHRQGTAIFNDSFISNAPNGDIHQNDWINRNIFWTACHEMGHTFNLTHSWQKSLGIQWIPLLDEPEARSFMNYPFNVNGGQQDFFSDFEFRFSDGELLFMRHAPIRFVQQGNADWFDDHGFQGAFISQQPKFELDLRVNREKAIFQYLEMINLELKLKNISGQPQNVDKNVLMMSDDMTIIIKKKDKSSRQFLPYARYLRTPDPVELKENKSLYESIGISAGRNGWDIAQPGEYVIRVALRLDSEDIISNPLNLFIAPAQSENEQMLSYEFFSDEVRSILAFNGSQFLEEGNKVLKKISENLGDRRIAYHSNYALGNVISRDYKKLEIQSGEQGQKKHYKITIEPANFKRAVELLDSALLFKPEEQIETFGHINFKNRIDQYSDLLVFKERGNEAVAAQDKLYKTMNARKIHGRPILNAVLEDIKKKKDKIEDKK
jgi:hypothetical protein